MPERAVRLLHFSEAVCRRHQDEADRRLLPRIAETDRLFRRLGVEARANEWLERDAWKRSLALVLLGDLLAGGDGRRLLDVGGGLSSLTLALAEQFDYTLVERADHEREADYHRLEEHLGRRFVRLGDWFELDVVGPFDVVIANDLFPNVDQRLYEFVERYLPRTREMRLSLTYFEHTVFDVRRLPSGERLVVKPWGLRDVVRLVDSLAADWGARVDDESRANLVYEDYSGRLFHNRRNIVLLWLTSLEAR